MNIVTHLFGPQFFQMKMILVMDKDNVKILSL